MQYQTFVTELAKASGHQLDPNQAACRLQNDQGLDVLVIEQGHHDGEAYLMSEVMAAPADLTLRDAVNKTFLQMNGVLEELPDTRITYNPQTDHYLVIRSTRDAEEAMAVCEELILLAERLRDMISEVAKEKADMDSAAGHDRSMSV